MGIAIFFNKFTTADVTSAFSGKSLGPPMYHPLETINVSIKCIFSDIKEKNEVKRTKNHQ